MYYIKLILNVLLFAAFAYFFVRVIYGKIKLHGIRLKLQEQGLISKDLNIIWLTFFSVIFWLIPVLKFKSIKDSKHNKEAKTVNISLFGLLVTFILFVIIGNVLN